MYSCVLCRPAGMCVGGDIEIKVWLHMIFVQNFTQPDFQAKSFTLQKCVICDIFLANYQRKYINYQYFGIFCLYVS